MPLGSERVLDLYADVILASVEIFRIEHGGFERPSRGNEGRVPIRELIALFEVEGVLK